MQKYARIKEELVVELFETDGYMAEMFHPDLIWVTATDTTQVGDTCENGEFSKLVVVSNITKESLTAAVADQRYQVEIGGVSVAGIRINTEREAQAKLNAAYTSLQAGLIPSTDWKADDGKWTNVDLAGITLIATAVAMHVAACFSAEKSHQTAIALLKTQAQIDLYDVTVGWPA